MTRRPPTSIAARSSARTIIRSSIAGCAFLAARPRSGAAACAEFDAIDFERRDWVPHSGWPFGPDEIRPIWPKRGPCSASNGVDIAPACRGRSLLQRLSSEELAVRWWSFDPVFDRFTIDRARRPGRRSALHPADPCHGAGGDAGRRQAGSVERLDVRTPSGRTIDIRARHYLLAAGGIENPRILLASNSVVVERRRQCLRPGRPLFHGASPCARRPHRRQGRLALAVGLRQAASQRASRCRPRLRRPSALQRREGLLNSALTIAVRQPEGGNYPLAKRAYLHVKHRTAPTRTGSFAVEGRPSSWCGATPG